MPIRQPWQRPERGNPGLPWRHASQEKAVKSEPRTAEHIDAVLTSVREAWLRHPHLRLGQMIHNAVAGLAFYVADEDLAKTLDKWRDG